MNHKQAVRCGLEWCGLCYAGLRGRSFSPGHLGYGRRVVRRVQCMGIMKERPQSAAGGEGGVGPFSVSFGDWGKWYPAVCEFLSLQRWEDGRTRTTGTVMLMVEGGLWKGWCHDRDRWEGLFVSSGTPEGVLEGLEAILLSGVGDWRPDRKPGKK